MSVGVVIATYGDHGWRDLAANRALPSVAGQSVPADSVVLEHAPTLAQARNQGVRRLQADWVVFLDADDQLDSGYVEAMLAGVGDVRIPKLQWTEGQKAIGDPHWLPGRKLGRANFVPIGAMVRCDDVASVGGFEEQPVLEDWVLWLKLAAAGAEFGWADAVYRAEVAPDGRNTLHAPLADRTAQEIRRRFAHSRKAVFA